MIAEKIQNKDSEETRIALLEQSIVTISQTLIRLENKIDIGFSEIRKEFKDVRKEIKSDFKWTLAIIGAVAAVMAHGFHWF